jgi:hypothetical protein
MRATRCRPMTSRSSGAHAPADEPTTRGVALQREEEGNGTPTRRLPDTSCRPVPPSSIAPCSRGRGDGFGTRSTQRRGRDHARSKPPREGHCSSLRDRGVFRASGSTRGGIALASEIDRPPGCVSFRRIERGAPTLLVTASRLPGAGPCRDCSTRCETSRSWRLLVSRRSLAVLVSDEENDATSGESARTTSTTKKRAGWCSANFVRRTVLSDAMLCNGDCRAIVRNSFPQLRTIPTPAVHSPSGTFREFSPCFSPA